MRYISVVFGLIVTLSSCHLKNQKTSFMFKENNLGIELLEKNQKVFFYQMEPKSSDGQYQYNNYIHPLYSLNGDTLTEEFPADHPYHRGIFWAWHQIYINGKSIGDGWIMKNIEQLVTGIQTSTKNQKATLTVKVLWKSPIFEESKSFLSEHTTIIVHPTEKGIRKIDFEISLKALVPGLEIGGANDEKGYGGLCARLKLPKDMVFTSVSGSVTPQLNQIKAGPWMDFSASFGIKGEKSGVLILCHPKTPNYPAAWILRSETSMQNIVFPGKNRVDIQMNKPTVLYYRLIIHNGDASKINHNKIQKEYESLSENILESN